MNNKNPPLLGLLIEDDQEKLAQMLEFLSGTVSGFDLSWDPANKFDDALARIRKYRYDIVITDVYDTKNDTVVREDDKAQHVVAAIRKTRMCPIIVYSSRRRPESMEKEGPFLKYVDKAAVEEVESALRSLVKTGIPGIARCLHDELDAVSGPSFLWTFLQDHWDKLQEGGFTSPETLERLIRKRASVQLGRLDPRRTDVKEIDSVSASEYYLMPPVADGLRLGSILRKLDVNEFFVVLTPHCHLAIQEGKLCPRADYVLLVPMIPFHAVTDKNPDNDPRKVTNERKRDDRLRRIIQSPPQIGTPQGRYWFLPGFLDIPDSYCDFMQSQSVPYETATSSDYEPLATLDTPFAEAFQSCFTAFYGSIGLPGLKSENFGHLVEPEQSDPSH
uniref:Uncharacterized protein n=1 Tax=Candidatus Kentrum sp. LPFa TaxID=2126335 RepID=A0A450WFE1_9GAMM|nr:MAG: hypothetical protein BECKLPF1236A_GA0070988_101323 [Candidatus Kentron sp. LPFa]VFK28808.1 MAG: hypothetical protein BECKLPF1236C_GA0070990_1007416 [Candidatus Kentron sp. LPFa]